MDETSDLFGGGAEKNGSPSQKSKNIKDDWSEGCRLLFQSGYLKVIKEMAISGQLQQYNLRSVCWRLFLGCLPEDKSKWADAAKKSRDKFTSIKTEHIVDPHSKKGGIDLAVHNPLSLADDSPWNQYFQDNDLKVMINQDVVRTFPDVQFFRQPHIQTMLIDLLFCYSRENEELGYRQGMHEILAPIVFVMHAEQREPNDPSLAPEVQNILDPKYIEHDTYTIFAELMESVGPWYMSTALEADFYRARAQSRRKMNHDPRTNKPFQDIADMAPTSAISRKLGVIHNLHLKNADEVLFSHLKTLSIPPQTYGIRWIRLLFGREFPLPTVLELWDALFADGPSLGLVDYMCVAMLMHIRDVLTEGDYATCMQYLMRFPPVYEVNYLVQRSLHLRNPSQYPSPRIWSHSPAAASTLSLGSTSGAINNSDNVPQPNKPLTKVSVKQGLKQLQTHLNKIPSRNSGKSQSGPRLEFHSGPLRSRSRSPSPDHTPLKEHPLQQSGELPPRKGRGRIIGSVKQTPPADKSSREMSENPKTSPLDTTSSQVDKLTNRIDDLQAKCLYCGGKTETLIAALQDEILKLEGLSPETENTLLMSLAGLKHVRDLLLNKIPFSGEASGFDNIMKHHSQQQQQLEDSQGSAVVLDTPPGDHMTVTKNRSDHESSLEVGTEVTGDEEPSEEWVSVSNEDTEVHPLAPHPLVNSGD